MALPTHARRSQIVTPDRALVHEQVDEVEIPGAEGYFGVLPGHTPLLAALAVGELWYRKGQEKTYLSIAFGFAEVLPDRVTDPGADRRARRGHRRRARRSGEAARRGAAARRPQDIDFERARVALIEVARAPAGRVAQPVRRPRRPAAHDDAAWPDAAVLGRPHGPRSPPKQQRRQLLHPRRSRPVRRRRRHGRPRRRRGRVAGRGRSHRDLHRRDRRRRQEPHLAVSVRAADQPRRQPPQGGVPARQPPDRHRDGRLRRICAAWRRRRPRCWSAAAARASRTSATAASTCCASGKLEQITDDHSWVEEQVRAGTLTRDGGAAASVAQRRHARAVGRRRSRSRHRRARRRSRASAICSVRTACSGVVAARAHRARCSASTTAALDDDLRAARSTRRTRRAAPTTSRSLVLEDRCSITSRSCRATAA